jgi:SH3 domain-containing YSC84-like protein 1
MKRLGILFGLLLLSACMMWAQDTSATSSSNVNNGDTTATQQDNNSTTQSSTTTTTTTTTSNDDRAQSDNTATQSKPDHDAVKQSRKDAAVRDENAADAAKQRAKDSGTEQGENREKAVARLDDAAKIINQLLAAPDNGIPEQVFTKAKCIAVVPSMVKGGFIFGAEHGRGVASCRLANGTWSAPAFFVVTGGNWGAQIGAQAVDMTMLIMNENGMNQLLSSKWKLGGNASASAGPVGRTAAADTNLKFNSEILTYSRSRGAYIGAVLNGANIKDDEDAMTGYYGRDVGFRPVLTGQAKDPNPVKDRFTAALHKTRAEVNAEAH